MTDPDPVAALAAQRRGCAGAAARQGGAGQVRARLETSSGQVLMLRLEIRKPGQKTGAAIARREAGEPQAPYWLGLSGDEREAVLPNCGPGPDRSAWSGTGATSRSSYPAGPRPGAVIELSTVRAEWRRIYGDPASRP